MRRIIDYNLNHQLLIYIIVPITVLFLFQIPYLFYVINVNEEASIGYIDTQLNIAYDNMSQELNAVKSAGDSLAYSTTMSDFLYEENEYKRFEELESINDILATIQYYSSIIESVFLVDEGSILGLYHGITYSNQLGDIQKIYTDNFIDNQKAQNGQFCLRENSNGKGVLIYITSVVELGQSDYVGAYLDATDALVFFINLNNLKLANEEEIKYYISDESGKYFFEGELVSQSDYIKVANSKKYVMSTEHEDSGLTLYAVSDFQQQNDTITSTGLLFMLSILVAVVLIIITGYMWNQNIVRPLLNISREMRDDTSLLNHNFTAGPKNQIGEIIEKLNEMMERNRTTTSNLIKMQSQIFESEITKNELRYVALKNQINPHFIYNTLASIKGMARLYDAPVIAEQCQAVSEILRYSLKGANLVPLSEELNIIRQYTTIMSSRFEGKFVIRFDIPPEYLDTKIVKMSLQPLVENCINHGFEDIDSGGEISVTARKDFCNIVLEITDNGCGFSQEVYDKIQNMLNLNSEQYKESSDSIGMMNINRRLKLAFGQEYGLIVEKREKGSTVKICYPIDSPAIEF